MENIECPNCHSIRTRFMYSIRGIDRYLCLDCLKQFDLTPLEKMERKERERKA